MSVAEQEVSVGQKRTCLFPEEVAVDQGISVSTVYRALRANPPELPGRKVRHQWRIPIDQYEAYCRGEWEPKPRPTNVVPMRRTGR